LTFPQFDPVNGTLTEVTITYDPALTGSMAVENVSTSSSCHATLNWGADVTLDTSDGVLTSILGQTETPTLSIFEPVRVFWRLFFLRGWGHVKFKQVCAGGAGAGGSARVRASGRV
jgi:hypothetical protein